MRFLNLPQRVAIVVGVGAAVYISGQWLTSLGSSVSFGWVAYAPLSNNLGPDGLHPWVRYVIWLVLITFWVLVSVAFLRSDASSGTDRE